MVYSNNSPSTAELAAVSCRAVVGRTRPHEGRSLSPGWSREFRPRHRGRLQRCREVRDAARHERKVRDERQPQRYAVAALLARSARDHRTMASVPEPGWFSADRTRPSTQPMDRGAILHHSSTSRAQKVMTARSHLFTAQDAAVNSTAALSVESHTSLDEAAVSSIITGRPSTTSPLQVGASLPRKCTLAPCCAYLRAGCLTLAPRVLILSSTRVRSPVRSSRCAGRRTDGDAKLDGAPAAACASLGPPWTE